MRWRRLRIETFTRGLFACQMCGRLEGKTHPLVCDHVRPHRGDHQKFWDPNNLQTLCRYGQIR
ncbi:MAG: HNH endonuclease [bacterium]|nr:HNH endonuclease [bacterium]